MFGAEDEDSDHKNAINFLILCLKFYIYICKFRLSTLIFKMWSLDPWFELCVCLCLLMLSRPCQLQVQVIKNWAKKLKRLRLGIHLVCLFVCLFFFRLGVVVVVVVIVFCL